MRSTFILWLALTAMAVRADEMPSLDAAAFDLLRKADVVIAGEVHDNPEHHRVQAHLAQVLRPRALVFEMLTEVQAEAITHELRADGDTLADALNWDESGWPDFALYYPIIAAVPDAVIHGAGVPRDAARMAMSEGVGASFGEEAADFGLDAPLSAEEQDAREAFQMAAHCDALPENILPGMVAVQRLRDATLARETARALDRTGGPVLVITGNGHAREDWGMPVYLERILPRAEIVTLGQGEAGDAPAGSFDLTLNTAAAPERDDPCAAFR